MTTWLCPACQFAIPRNAKICGHCRTDIIEYEVEQAAQRRADRAERSAQSDVLWAGFPHSKTLIGGAVLGVLLVIQNIVAPEEPIEGIGDWLLMPLAGVFSAYCSVISWRWLMMKLRGYP